MGHKVILKIAILDKEKKCLGTSGARKYVFFMCAGEFIIGRVIKAMNNSWHPECFCCDICHNVLADVGFAKNAGR